jgi:histidinol-phosphate aminotransferase
MTIRPEIQSLPGYKPGVKAKRATVGPDGKPLARLNANEGPYPPFPDAVAAMHAAVDEGNWYPDLSFYDFKAALAELHGVGMERIVVGSGSAPLIRLLMLVTLRSGDEVLYPWPPYPAHGVALHLHGGVAVRTPLRDGACDMEALLSRVTPSTRMALICSPHNPTGSVVTRRDFERYFARVPDHVVTVLDQAYQDFVTDRDAVDGLTYLDRGKPIVVFRTLSKVYGLAGVRSGYALASAELAEAMNKSNETFAMSSVAAAGSIASIKRQDLMRERVERIAAEREKLKRACDALGLAYTPTEANFIWIDVRRSAKDVADAMQRRGFMIRSGEVHDEPNFIRISVGRPEQNDGVIRALRETLAEVPEQREKVHQPTA